MFHIKGSHRWRVYQICTSDRLIVENNCYTESTFYMKQSVEQGQKKEFWFLILLTQVREDTHNYFFLMVRPLKGGWGGVKHGMIKKNDQNLKK